MKCSTDLPAVFVLAPLCVVSLDDRNFDALSLTEELAEARVTSLHFTPSLRMSGAKNCRSVSSIAAPYAS